MDIVNILSVFGIYYITSHFLDVSEHPQNAQISSASTTLYKEFVELSINAWNQNIDKSSDANEAVLKAYEGVEVTNMKAAAHVQLEILENLVKHIWMFVQRFEDDDGNNLINQFARGSASVTDRQGEYDLLELARTTWSDVLNTELKGYNGLYNTKTPHWVIDKKQKSVDVISLRDRVNIAKRRIDGRLAHDRFKIAKHGDQQYSDIQQEDVQKGQWGAYQDYLEEEAALTNEMNRLNSTPATLFNEFELNADEPLDTSKLADIALSSAALHNEMTAATLLIGGNDTGHQYAQALYGDNDNSNASQSLLGAFEQSIDGREEPVTGRDSVRGNLYDMHPMGAETTIDTNSPGLFGDTLTSLLSDFSVKEAKHERFNDSHFDDSNTQIGIGAPDLRSYYDDLVSSSYQVLQRHDEKPTFYNVETGLDDPAGVPDHKAGMLTADDRFILNPSVTNPNIDSDGYVKPIIMGDMGRADRQPSTTWQTPVHNTATSVPLRAEYNEGAVQDMIPMDSYHKAPPTTTAATENPKINAHIEFYTGQKTGDAPVFNHNNEILLDDPKKSDIAHIHSSWQTGPKQPSHNGPDDSVKASLRNEYLEYSSRVGNKGVYNDQHDTSINSDFIRRGIDNNQNIRSDYQENQRVMENATSFTDQRADLLTNMNIPARNMPDIIADIDTGLLDALKYNPLVV